MQYTSFRPAMRPANRSYTLQTSCEEQTPKSVQPNKYKRLYSLQKIRINHKGLPADFFRPLTSSRAPPRSQKRQPRAATNPAQAEQVRTTPQFPDSVTEAYQPRQYKSEERRDRVEAKPFSQHPMQAEKQYTFSQSFFEPQQKFQKSSSKYHTEKKCVRRDVGEGRRAVWEEERQMDTQHELSQLASRKYAGRQKYLNWQQARTPQPKPKNTLPILKARFPSAFGI